MLLARVTTTVPLCLQRTVHSMPLSAYINQAVVMLVESRGREASTGWVWGLLIADTRVSKLKGKCDGNIEVYFVDTICNCAGHK